jgi:hypothetical protein
MAVVDLYKNASLEPTAARRRVPGQNFTGAKTVKLVQTFEVVAADDDASVYRVFANVPATMILLSMRLSCDAIANATDWDFGLYLPNDGAVVDKDLLADGMNVAAGFSRILALDALVTVDIANVNKNLWELARDGAGALAYTLQSHPAAFDLVLTLNAAGTAAGTVTMIGEGLLPS